MLELRRSVCGRMSGSSGGNGRAVMGGMGLRRRRHLNYRWKGASRTGTEFELDAANFPEDERFSRPA